MRLPKDKYKLVVISLVLYVGWTFLGDLLQSPYVYKCTGIAIWSKRQCSLLLDISKWFTRVGFILSMFYIWSLRFRNLFNRNKITKSRD